MKPLILTYPGNELVASGVAKDLQGEPADFELRNFPDGETYFQLISPTKDRSMVVFCSLDRPDKKVLPLLFISETARELGVKKIGLVAPYLGYLRQDKRFNEGEAITSRYFSRLFSGYFDWLVTVDPHLHRISELPQIYSIPCHVVHAAPEISKWIRDHVQKPLLIGPDSESLQWVKSIAKNADAPFLICEKERLGDRRVKVTVPLRQLPSDHTPVLVDDIISTGRSMIEALVQIKEFGAAPPVCIGVHAVFSGNAYQELLEAGARQVVTCNTITHPSNVIDLSPLLSGEIRRLL